MLSVGFGCQSSVCFFSSDKKKKKKVTLEKGRMGKDNVFLSSLDFSLKTTSLGVFFNVL